MLTDYPLFLTQRGDEGVEGPLFSVEGTLPPMHELNSKTGLTRAELNEYFMKLGMQTKQRNEIFRALEKDRVYSVTISLKSAKDLVWPFDKAGPDSDTSGESSLSGISHRRKP